MTGLQRFPYARPRPELPCHPTHCAACGYTLALEVHGGVVHEHCAGCARNRQRAALGLPALTYERPAATEFPVAANARTGPSAMQRAALSQVPLGRARASTTNAIACVLHKSRASTDNILRDLMHFHLVTSFVQCVHGKSTRFWYAPVEETE